MRPIHQAQARPQIGVGGILFSQGGEVLLIRRGQPPASGLWSVPGGKLEAGETMVQACRREFREETGLDVCVGPLIAVAERRIEGFHYVILDFVVTLGEREVRAPRASGDASQARWVPVEHLGQFLLVEGLRTLIERAWTAARERHAQGLVDDDGRERDFRLQIRQ